MTTGPRHPVDGTQDALWQGPALERLLGDLMGAVLGRMRPGRAAHRPVWSSDLPLGDGGLGADSLERLRLGEAGPTTC